MGDFPNQGNPNRVRPQHYQFRMPANPRVAAQITPLIRQLFGVAINGVVFDPGTAEYWQGSPQWHYEAISKTLDLGLDSNHAHVQPSGAYHYHGIPTGLISHFEQQDKMMLIGYAADGFPIYNQYGFENHQDTNSPMRKMQSSDQLKSGQRPPDSLGGAYDSTFEQDYVFIAGAGDLDECNGRFGATLEYPQGIYHYYVTETFPFISRFYRGTPDPSFTRKGPPPFGLPPFGVPPLRPPLPPLNHYSQSN
ncbi:MAG: YHYH protein [Pseudanabaena sp. ELA607]